MHQVVILIEPVSNWQAFDEAWPDFLHFVEAMPGLRREASSRVDTFLFGSTAYAQMHMLFFDSREDAQRALASPPGRAAGALLQRITGGRMALFFAEYQEDDIVNIRQYKEAG